MARCSGCGGILGKDCFNQRECMWISEQQDEQERQYIEEQQEQERQYYEDQYNQHIYEQEMGYYEAQQAYELQYLEEQEKRINAEQ